MTSVDPIIDVRGLTKSFGDKIAVDGVSLSVRQGEVFGFLGPNGSGKTTTIRMLCGLLTPDSGEGSCLGYDVITQRQEIQSRIGYMTQRFSLYDDLSIEENLRFIGQMYSMRDYLAATDRTLADLGLEDRRKQLAGTLSGGWKQRMALGACMMHHPQLLLLDEPTAGVDPKARRVFWDEIHRLAAAGTTVLVSTHYMDEAERCHRLAYLARGRLLAEGTAQELVTGSGLVTWRVTGAGVASLAPEIERLAGVDMVAAFGNALHVSGSDQPALAASIEKLRTRSDVECKPIEPGLEDVFIHYLADSERAR